jgi:hypothetical protein
MSEPLKELYALPDDELVKRHDEHAQHTQVGTNHYLRELERRDRDRQTRAMLRCTRWITVMTVVMTICTIINLVAVCTRCAR